MPPKSRIGKLSSVRCLTGKLLTKRLFRPASRWLGILQNMNDPSALRQSDRSAWRRLLPPFARRGRREHVNRLYEFLGEVDLERAPSERRPLKGRDNRRSNPKPLSPVQVLASARHCDRSSHAHSYTHPPRKLQRSGLICNQLSLMFIPQWLEAAHPSKIGESDSFPLATDLWSSGARTASVNPRKFRDRARLGLHL